MVPLVLHRIWFGSFLPEAYQAHLVQLIQHNPSYCVMLWTDFATLTVDEQAQFLTFASSHGVQVRDVREHTELTNYVVIEEALDAIVQDAKHRLVHCVRASDVARVSILLEEGGVYTDTDTLSCKALPTLDAPLGLLVKPNRLDEYLAQYTRNDYPEYCQIYNDFLAALPNNSILKFAADITRLDYQTYHNSAHKAWESSTSREVHLLSTIRLTGSSLRWAINYKIAHGEIASNERADLFFDDAEFLEATYDKSWLAACEDDVSKIDEAWQSMLLFRDEIDAKRNRVFPCCLPQVEQEKSYNFNMPKIDFNPQGFQPPSIADMKAWLDQGKDGEVFTPETLNLVLPPFEYQLPFFETPDIKSDTSLSELPCVKIPNFRSSALPCRLLRDFLKEHGSFLNRFRSQGNINRAVEKALDAIKEVALINLDDLIETLASIAVRASSDQALALNGIVRQLNESLSCEVVDPALRVQVK